MMVKARALDEPRNGTASTLHSSKKYEVFDMIISSIELQVLSPTRPLRSTAGIGREYLGGSPRRTMTRARYFQLHPRSAA
jgi:hypothetical protein